MILLLAFINIIYLHLIKKYNKDKYVSVLLLLSGIGFFILSILKIKVFSMNFLNEQNSTFLIFGFLNLLFASESYRKYDVRNNYSYAFISLLLAVNNLYFYMFGLLVVLIEQVNTSQQKEKLVKNNINLIYIFFLIYVAFQNQLKILQEFESAAIVVSILIILKNNLNQIESKLIFSVLLLLAFGKELNEDLNIIYILIILLMLYLTSSYYSIVYKKYFVKYKYNVVIEFFEKIKIKNNFVLPKTYYSFEYNEKDTKPLPQKRSELNAFLYENDLRKKFLLIISIILLIVFCLTLKD